jgi:hypothetical protein
VDAVVLLVLHAQLLALGIYSKLVQFAGRDIAALWIVCGSCGVVVALMVAEYSWRVGRQFPDVVFPTTYATCAAVFNAIALIAGILLWRKVSIWRNAHTES